MGTTLPRSSRIHGLDTLRSLAIILVFVFHYMAFVSHKPTFGWASTIGWVGVDLFFVLSGYLIGNQVFAGLMRGQRLSLKAFYFRRWLRTLPNFYVVVALYFLFPSVMGGTAPPPLWRFLTFTQNFWLHTGTAFSHAWSLCLEEQFYLLFPIVVLVGVRYGRSVRAGWVLIAALVCAGIATRSILWIHHSSGATYHSYIYYSSFCRLDEFLPGIAVAMLKNFHRDVWERIMKMGSLAAAAGLATVLTMFYLIHQYYFDDAHGRYGFFMTGFGYSLLAISFAVLLIASLAPGSVLYRTRIPGAAQLAAWSYALYLTHKAIAMILQRWLAPYCAPDSVVLLLVIVCACLIGAWLLYRLVETPFMRFRNSRYPTNFPDAPAGSPRCSPEF